MATSFDNNDTTETETNVVGCSGLPDEKKFPSGMKVLVVDDDLTCLEVTKTLLKSCNYDVTVCSEATRALALLREEENAFDLIVTDVHMPNLDGFKLLELVGLQMDLPVIMMSSDATFTTVMRGIRHGACDFLNKPLRISELRNIWQHVTRRKGFENQETEHSCGMEESDCSKACAGDADFPLTENDQNDGDVELQGKKRDANEDGIAGELENSSKKRRIAWSKELHIKFVNAVDQLGIHKAFPKRILDLMNEPGLTRENVASHLQKFRLGLKKMDRVALQHNGISNSFFTSPIGKSQLPKYDIFSFAASGQVPSKHDQLLSNPNISTMSKTNPQFIRDASAQGAKPVIYEPGVDTCGQFLIGDQVLAPSFQVLPRNDLGSLAGTSNSLGLSSSQNINMLAKLLQQHQSQYMPPGPRMNNMGPHSLLSPSQSSDNVHIQAARNAAIFGNQSSTSLCTGVNPVIINENPKSRSTGFIHPQWASQPFSSMQVPSYQHLISGDDMMIPTQLPTTLPTDSNLASIHSSSVASYCGFSSELDDGPYGLEQIFGGDFNSPENLFGCSTSGLGTYSNNDNSWKEHHGMNRQHKLPFIVPGSHSIQSGSLVGIGQGNLVNFSGEGSSLPSLIADNENEYLLGDFTPK